MLDFLYWLVWHAMIIAAVFAVMTLIIKGLE